jgi:hypothetical protein
MNKKRRCLFVYLKDENRSCATILTLNDFTPSPLHPEVNPIIGNAAGFPPLSRIFSLSFIGNPVFCIGNPDFYSLMSETMISFSVNTLNLLRPVRQYCLLLEDILNTYFKETNSSNITKLLNDLLPLLRKADHCHFLLVNFQFVLESFEIFVLCAVYEILHCIFLKVGRCA